MSKNKRQRRPRSSSGGFAKTGEKVPAMSAEALEKMMTQPASFPWAEPDPDAEPLGIMFKFRMFGYNDYGPNPKGGADFQDSSEITVFAENAEDAVMIAQSAIKKAFYWIKEVTQVEAVDLYDGNDEGEDRDGQSD